MSNLITLAEKREKLKGQIEQIDQEIVQVRQQLKKKLRSDIDRMCREAGTSVEELFGRSGAGKRPGKPKGPSKYICDGIEYDGRRARNLECFAAAIESGAINDAKALEAGFINPAWLESDKSAARQFVRDHGIKASLSG